MEHIPTQRNHLMTSVKVGSIGWAINQMEDNIKVCRKGWNGKQMWLALQIPDSGSMNTLPYIYIQYKVGSVAYPEGSRVPWLASQTDLLAEDWQEYKD